MRRVRLLIVTLALLCVAAWLMLMVGANLSLDWTRAHETRVASLPVWPEARDGELLIPVGGHRFRARLSGGGRAGNLVLLHGFPGSVATWAPLQHAAAAAGYRVLAFDQRGYSPGARPQRNSAYTLAQLAGDVLAIADRVGFERFHVVGEQGGAALAWRLAKQEPQRIVSVTALSVPLEAALTGAWQPRELSFLRYGAFAEYALAFDNFRALRTTALAGRPDAMVNDVLAVLAEPGALRAVLRWYRAPVLENKPADLSLKVPALFVWGQQDRALEITMVQRQRRLVASYAELAVDGGRWLLRDNYALLSSRILEHMAMQR